MPNQAVLEKFFGCNYFEFQQCLALREFGISSSVLSGSCGLVCGSRHGWPTLTSHKHSRWSKVELRTTWASFLASTLRKHCTLASFRTIQWLTKMIASEAKRDTHTHFVVYLCVVWKTESVEYPGGMSLSTQLSLEWYCMATKRTHCHLLSIERLLSLTLVFIEKFSPLPSQNENDSSNNDSHKNIRMKIRI